MIRTTLKGQPYHYIFKYTHGTRSTLSDRKDYPRYDYGFRLVRRNK